MAGERQVLVLFSNQLFTPEYLGLKADKVLLIEDKRFFCDFNFHKKKLIFHRASMKAYEDELKRHKMQVEYVELSHSKKLKLEGILRNTKAGNVVYFEPVDFDLKSRLEKAIIKLKLESKILKNPSFICSERQIEDFFGQSAHYSMANFYRHQRKTYGILLENGCPSGGKWSLDSQNREKLSRAIDVPDILVLSEGKYVKEAKRYVSKHFSGNIGMAEPFFYPVTRKQAKQWFTDFLVSRLNFFGTYEDAISKKHQFLFHSLLSVVLNSGLLTSEEVLKETLEYANQNNIQLNNLEGFVRQILGWREFMRAVYFLKGKEIKKGNFWDNKNSLSSKFYTANTGIEAVDFTIRKILRISYAHHIERLMILGNFMLLCQINPDQIYQWFMELFIDSYDWVMVGNVYAMSQYADGGTITTKPYISSSNYILKMSDFSKGQWCEIWDGLYWRFVNIHRDFFVGNPRTKMIVSILNRMSTSKLNKHIRIAERFLASL